MDFEDEKFEECEKLYNNYSDDSTFMLFPLSVMYYKKGDYKKPHKRGSQSPFSVGWIHKASGALLSRFDFNPQAATAYHRVRGNICILWISAILPDSLLCTFRSANQGTHRLIPLLPCFFLRCQP